MAIGQVCIHMAEVHGDANSPEIFHLHQLFFDVENGQAR